MPVRQDLHPATLCLPPCAHQCIMMYTKGHITHMPIFVYGCIMHSWAGGRSRRAPPPRTSSRSAVHASMCMCKEPLSYRMTAARAVMAYGAAAGADAAKAADGGLVRACSARIYIPVTARSAICR